MTDPAVRLRIGGADLPFDTHHLACQVEVERDARGRRTLRLAATGHAAPVLAGVTWSAAVSVSWLDLSTDGWVWLSLAVLSPGPQVSLDLAAVTCSWTLEGVEAAATGGPVTVGGTAYWASVEVSAPRALARRQVRISGEGVAAPAVSGGSAAVTSALYSGTVLALGVQVESDPETGLLKWSLEGWETTSGYVPVSVAGANYFARVERRPLGGTIQRKTDGSGTLLRAWGKWAVTISGEGVSAPAASGVVAIASALYTGDILVFGTRANSDPETGLISWTVEGEQP